MSAPVFHTKPNLRPLANRILVKRLERETTSKGGLVLPDTQTRMSLFGKVLVLGPGGRDEDGALIPFDVKVGDTVLFGKYAGLDIKIMGEEHLLLREDEVLGIVDVE